MKSAVSVFFLLIITAFELPGQNSDYGIYKCWQGYKNGKLYCSVNPDSSKGKIRPHYLLSGKYVDIIKDGKKYRFCKDSIFGYRDKQKNDYRFYKSHDKGYRIIESKEIIIYMTDIAVSSSYGKNVRLVPAYFFSASLSSQLIPLTLLNLKRAFPDNLKFHDMLDLEFGGGEALSAYSAKDNMYKVNYLLNKSLK